MGVISSLLLHSVSPTICDPLLKHFVILESSHVSSLYSTGHWGTFLRESDAHTKMWEPRYPDIEEDLNTQEINGIENIFNPSPNLKGRNSKTDACAIIE
jgi:hypothetical protein